jgi:hypothetical protein
MTVTDASTDLASLKATIGRRGAAHDAEALRAALQAGRLDAVDQGLAASARRMLAANLRLSPRTGRPFLVPAEHTYGAQSWLWDLVFGAHIARALADRATEADEREAFMRLTFGCLSRVFERQPTEGPERGRVAHMLFEGGVDAALWADPHASFITQPPVFAVATKTLLDAEQQAALWPQVRAGLDWWLRCRLDDAGLPAIRHPWESGEDAARYHDSQQLPAIAVALCLTHGVDPRPLNDVLPFDLDGALGEGDLLKLQTDNPSKKDALTKGARFVLLAALRHQAGEGLAVSDAGRALFDVRAPSMAAHLALDLRAGAALAEAHGDDGQRFVDAADRMVASIIDRQCGADGWPRALGHAPSPEVVDRTLALLGDKLSADERTRLTELLAHIDDAGRLAPRTGTAAIALGALPAGHDVTEAMLETIRSPAFAPRFGLPTLARDDDAFVGDDYWRGSVWINIDWLTTAGLLHQARGWGERHAEQTRRFAETAHALATGTLTSAVEGFYEHYHADGEHGRGVGCGPVDFTWSGLALLTVGQLREAKALLGD